MRWPSNRPPDHRRSPMRSSSPPPSAAPRRCGRSACAPGSRVVIAMDGSVDWAVAFWSVVQAGLVAVPVPAMVPPDLLGLVVFHAEARVCVLAESSPLHAAKLPPVLRVTPRALVERGSAALAAAAPPGLEARGLGPRAVPIRPTPPFSSSPPAARRGRARSSCRTPISSRICARSRASGRRTPTKRCSRSSRPRTSSSWSSGRSRPSPSARASSMPAHRCRTGSSTRFATGA